MKKVELIIKKIKNKDIKNGFSLVEVLISVSVFVLLFTALIGTYLYGQESTVLAGSRARAIFLSEEGLEAARNIRDSDFSNLVNGSHGLTISGNQWALSGSSDTTDIFTRIITISSLDTNRKQVISNVTWQQNPQRTGSVSLTTYLTNWQAAGQPQFGSCNEYAISEGYTSGTCRANTRACDRNNEDYLPDGDLLCTQGGLDTCCALP